MLPVPSNTYCLSHITIQYHYSISDSDNPSPHCILFPQDAIAAKQFYPIVRTIANGDVDSALSAAEHTLEGQLHVGGQDHFYLETQGCLAIPTGEDGEMEIIASTQDLHNTQMVAALALNVPANRIVARVKRIGEHVCVSSL